MRRFASRFLAVLGALMLIVVFTPVTGWIAHALAEGSLNDNIHGDVLVVLGGSGVQLHDVLGYTSYVRAEYALWNYTHPGGYRSIVLLGGGGPTPVSISMRDFLIQHGVPAAAITVETGSNSTRENALFSRDLLNTMPGRKVLLTSDYHMFRAVRVFRKAGIAITPRALPDGLKSAGSLNSRPTAAVEEAGELVKIVYYYIHGWM